MDLTALSWLDVLLLSAAALYAAVVITTKAGPFGVFAWLRARRFVGELAACIWCVLPYVSLVLLALYVSDWEAVVWLLALPGIALMLWSYTGVRHG